MHPYAYRLKDKASKFISKTIDFSETVLSKIKKKLTAKQWHEYSEEEVFKHIANQIYKLLANENIEKLDFYVGYEYDKIKHKHLLNLEYLNHSLGQINMSKYLEYSKQRGSKNKKLIVNFSSIIMRVENQAKLITALENHKYLKVTESGLLGFGLGSLFDIEGAEEKDNYFVVTVQLMDKYKYEENKND